MKSENLKTVYEIINKRAEKALKRGDNSAYVAYATALCVIECAEKDDDKGLAIFNR